MLVEGGHIAGRDIQHMAVVLMSESKTGTKDPFLIDNHDFRRHWAGTYELDCRHCAAKSGPNDCEHVQR